MTSRRLPMILLCAKPRARESHFQFISAASGGGVSLAVPKISASPLIPLGFLAAVPLLVSVGASPWMLVPGFLAVFAALDRLMGRAETHSARGADLFDRVGLWLYAPAQLAVMVWGLSETARRDVGSWLGLAIVIGMIAGIFGMLTAHELVHSRKPGDRRLGVAMLTAVCYGHFRIAHVFGHHRHAGTADDPALARRGESAFRFVTRSAAAQFVFAVRHDGRGVARAMGASLLWSAAVALAFGPAGLAFQLVVSAIAIFILELFNYIAHYGLARRPIDGTLEPFGQHHSWNVAQRFSNAALLNGGRHSDHHRAPAKPFRALAPDAAAPILPFGFAGNICLALMPPLWRRVMNPRVDAWMSGR
jgi:alkane 1-monooxygenase